MRALLVLFALVASAAPVRAHDLEFDPNHPFADLVTPGPFIDVTLRDMIDMCNRSAQHSWSCTGYLHGVIWMHDLITRRAPGHRLFCVPKEVRGYSDCMLGHLQNFAASNPTAANGPATAAVAAYLSNTFPCDAKPMTLKRYCGIDPQ